jgi:hypothetical protein
MYRDMSNQSYTSSQLYSYFVPGATCVLGLFALISGVVLVTTTGDWRKFLFPGAMGGLLLYLLAQSWRNFGLVTVSPTGVTVRQQGGEFNFGWRDVASFRTIPFVSPPIYRLSFRGTDLVTYFVPVQSVSLSVVFWTFHFSGMGKFIQTQLREFGLT